MEKNLNKKLIEISKMNVKTLKAELTDLKVTFDESLKKEDLQELLISVVVAEETKLNSIQHMDNLTEEELQKRATEILEEANKHNEVLAGLKTPEEKQIYLETLADEIAPEVTELITEAFPELMEAGDSPVSTDLPASQILTNLPIRIVDQVIANVLVDYPLMNTVQKELVTNGIKQIFYKDYRDVNDTSAFSDVVIGDYNQGTEPTFTETYKVDTEIHKGFDILSSLLNDVTVTVGLFVALIKDFTIAIARPFAKKMYARLVTFLDKTASYDKIITFTGADAKDKAKEVYEEIVSLSTPSRDNLTKKPNGSAKALEYSLKSGNANLILNKKYSADYKYDLSANTFQLGEITIPVKSITVIDFDKVAQYSENLPATDVLKGLEVILMEDGVYQEMLHYQGTKQVATPKLKDVFHKYVRIGNYRRKDKILLAFKNA